MYCFSVHINTSERINQPANIENIIFKETLHKPVFPYDIPRNAKGMGKIYRGNNAISEMQSPKLFPLFPVSFLTRRLNSRKALSDQRILVPLKVKPRKSESRIPSQWVRANAGKSSIDILSIPGAPLLAFTRFQACRALSRDSICASRLAFGSDGSMTCRMRTPPVGFTM